MTGRKRKMNKIFINMAISVWLGVSWIVAFGLMLTGHYLHEPNYKILWMEMLLAGIATTITIFNSLRIANDYKRNAE